MTPTKLLEEARKAATKAYCPYSKFHVGAALLTESGKVYTGANVENASYGLSVCAERIAIYKAVTDGEKVKELAVTCADAVENANNLTKMPCGACRQIMAEFMETDAKVHVDSVKTFSLNELLPHGFVLDD